MKKSCSPTTFALTLADIAEQDFRERYYAYQAKLKSIWRAKIICPACDGNPKGCGYMDMEEREKCFKGTIIPMSWD